MATGRKHLTKIPSERRGFFFDPIIVDPSGFLTLRVANYLFYFGRNGQNGQAKLIHSLFIR